MNTYRKQVTFFQLLAHHIIRKEILFLISLTASFLYSQENTVTKPCISCSLQNGTLKTVGGIIASTRYFEARQDYAVPIPGFVIIASKRHIKSMDDFVAEEKNDFIEFLYFLRKKMREQLKIETVYLVQEEDSSHFHFWLFPQYTWMQQFGSGIKSVQATMQWAKEHLHTKENLETVKAAVEILQNRAFGE
jgi:diadenosine tetraphosphate (Ap4A) HIT family hydrolase